MIAYCWFFFLLIFVQSGIDGTAISGEAYKIELPLYNGESQPPPIIVHIWISRADDGERSCMGVRKKGNRILVPEWCVTVRGERRGRIAIYAPKLPGKVTSFSRACPYQRYDQQFDFLYENDDLRKVIQASDGLPGTDKPNVVVLEIPEISHTHIAHFWTGDMFAHMSDNSILVSWKRGSNGEFFFVQKLVDQSIKQKRSFEILRESFQEAEAVLTVDNTDGTLIFEGFFKDPPKF